MEEKFSDTRYGHGHVFRGWLFQHFENQGEGGDDFREQISKIMHRVDSHFKTPHYSIFSPLSTNSTADFYLDIS